MSVHRFHFRTRWFGYDRAEVDRLLDQVAGDRQILKDKLNYLEAVVARQNAAAGGQSLPGLETEAAVKAALSVERLQLDRLRELTREMTACIEGCGAALRQAHDLVTLDFPALEDHETAPTAAPADVEPPALPDDARAVVRRMAYASLAVLAVGGGAVTAVSRTPATPSVTSASVASLAPILPATPPADHAQGAASLHAIKIADAAEAPPAPREETAKTDRELSVLLRASGSCWIRSVVDGSHVVERLLQSGDTLLVSAHEEILLRAGDGGALTVTIDGRAVPFGRAGQVVTRRITRQNAKLLLQDQV